MSFYKLSLSNIIRPVVRYFSLMFVLILTALPLLACQPEGPAAKQRDADYGTAGTEFAETLARNFPRRVPGSDVEAGAARFIFDQLTLLGFSPQKQDFSFYKTGVQKESQNIIAKLDGAGFTYSPQFERDRKENYPEKIDDRILIIGAHYDTPDFAPKADENGYVPPNTADGIHNNASGVATVMMAAKQMLLQKPGYDIHFVFFGAGTNRQDGAKAYLKSLSSNEIERVDAMVNIGPIYAGDKIYAHAGQNSVMSGSVKDYNMRRKLYQVTDIFFDYVLNTQNNYAVYTNQTDYYMPYTPLGGGPKQLGLYREWTVTESDHTPFDDAGIPVVFMESGDYNVVDKDDLGQENTSPRFAPTQGMISASLFDETDYLKDFFRTLEKEADIELPSFPDLTGPEGTNPETGATSAETSKTDESDDENAYDDDRLTKRINNTAFVLVQLARRGPVDYGFDQ